jgi:hypothetical protein
LQRLGRENGFDDLFFPNAGWALLGPLAYRSRLGPFEADRLLHTVAIEALTARPWQTVVSSVRAMDRMVAADNIKDAAQWAWLRPDGFDARQHAIGQVWHNDEFALYRALAEFTPHRSESSVSRWAEYVLAARIWTSRLWRGRWVILAMVAGGLYGVWRRDPFIVLFASMAFAQLGAAAFGDKPIGRYWDPAVPFLIPMLVFATGDIARRLRNRRVKTAV